MACKPCKVRWNRESNQPLQLHCNHVICKACVKKAKTELNRFKCPICENITVVDIASNFGENFEDYSMRCVEQLNKRLELVSKTRRDFEPMETCEDHPECLVVAYCEKPFSKLCNQCIQEMKDLTKYLKIRPYPEMVQIIRQRLVHYKNICMVNLEHMNSSMDKFRSESDNNQLKLQIESRFQALLQQTKKLKQDHYEELKRNVDYQQITLSRISDYARQQSAYQHHYLERVLRLQSYDDKQKVINIDAIKSFYNEAKSNITDYPKLNHITTLRVNIDESQLLNILRSSYEIASNRSNNINLS